jgi:hypothetical protein
MASGTVSVETRQRDERTRLDGACVFLAGFGDGKAKADARSRLEALGARVVDVPFGNVTVCVVPDEQPDTPIDARLAVRSVPVVLLSRALGGARPGSP